MQQEKIQLLLQEIQELAAAGGITNSVREREREGEREGGREGEREREGGRGEREVILIFILSYTILSIVTGETSHLVTGIYCCSSPCLLLYSIGCGR